MMYIACKLQGHVFTTVEHPVTKMSHNKCSRCKREFIGEMPEDSGWFKYSRAFALLGMYPTVDFRTLTREPWRATKEDKIYYYNNIEESKKLYFRPVPGSEVIK